MTTISAKESNAICRLLTQSLRVNCRTPRTILIMPHDVIYAQWHAPEFMRWIRCADARSRYSTRKRNVVKIAGGPAKVYFKTLISQSRQSCANSVASRPATPLSSSPNRTTRRLNSRGDAETWAKQNIPRATKRENGFGKSWRLTSWRKGDKVEKPLSSWNKRKLRRTFKSNNDFSAV